MPRAFTHWPAGAHRIAWFKRDRVASSERSALERQFLPAALEIMDTPVPVLPRAIMGVIIFAFGCAVAWSALGEIDMVAVAPGKIIAVDKTKLIQPVETGIVRRIHVRDGQKVEAGDVLIELDAAATATGAEATRISEALAASRIESARYGVLAGAASGTSAMVSFAKSDMPEQAPKAALRNEQLTLDSQYREHRARLSTLDAELTRRQAELAAVEALSAKLRETVPIAKRRADDFRELVTKNFVSHHGYLEREQVRIEQERDLDYQQSKVGEILATIDETRKRRDSLVAEFERMALTAKLDADKRAAQMLQELVKARAREGQQTLTAPVKGTVQQLAVHTIGGVVTPAQQLMVIAPADFSPEVEAVLENKDVGFVKVGQLVEVKVETFPFTRYGTVPGKVSFVSKDAVNDEKLGLVFHARVKLERTTIVVPGREVNLSPGMAVSAEISTGTRRLITFFLDPLRKATYDSFRER